MKKSLFSIFLSLALAPGTSCGRAERVLEAEAYGVAPGRAFSATEVRRLLEDAKAASAEGGCAIVFAPGRYAIGPSQCQERLWFVSNHDQDNPKRVFLPLEGLERVSIRGEGAWFDLEGRIIPVGVWDCAEVTLSGLTVDYVTPPITQIELLAVDAQAKTVTFRPIAGTQATLEGRRLVFSGPDFRLSPWGGILFEADGHVAYRTGDTPFPLGDVSANGDGSFTAHGCAHPAFKAGQHMALRGWERPAPGIAISDSRDIRLENLTIHYADGMGVLAQASENLALRGVKVVPNRAKGRFFSTQADATHFSGCKGRIVSEGGEYVGMMDDAINVHGTYLRVERVLDERTVEAAYMHPQSYGFTWGAPGDAVDFVRSRTMERVEGADNTLVSIAPLDKPSVRAGAKRFRLAFAKALPEAVRDGKTPLGLENLTWTPEVRFTENRIADNRARGALFSTPKPVLCARNVFDHTSGCAVLLCGDCNGWYETGACTDVRIEDNRFVNALTSEYQFTEAVVSICPEIPDLAGQTRPFHRNIRICGNRFETFDRPLVYAKSVDGLIVKGNAVVRNRDFPPFHRNRNWLTLRRCGRLESEPPEELSRKE